MILYIVPLVIFIFVSIGMYLVSKDTKKNKIDVILTRNVLPALTLSLLVFLIIKYKDSEILNPEPIMYGNYWD